MQETTLIHRSRVPYIILGICLLLIIGIGIYWYVTFNNLQQVHRALDLQEQETQKYLKLNNQHESELTEKSTQLNETEAKLAVTESELDDTKSLYETTNFQLSQVQSQLQQIDRDLEEVTDELARYKETWGSVVESGVKPPFINVHLVNNSQSVNPTWAQLQAFIFTDKTDENPYVPDSYVCGEFASDVHNNAESSGIRCALVALEFQDVWHACNAFITTDRGLVFIDCTGVMSGDGPSNCDKTVTVKLGREYVPVSLFPQPGWLSVWESMGLIQDVQIYW
jgi:hypothetical protein